jgi:hypothetical protein
VTDRDPTLLFTGQVRIVCLPLFIVRKGFIGLLEITEPSRIPATALHVRMTGFGDTPVGPFDARLVGLSIDPQAKIKIVCHGRFTSFFAS